MGVSPPPLEGVTALDVITGPIADAATFLQSEDRRPAERLLLAAIRLDEVLTSRDAWTEPDLAALTALSRHQVRQAVARLRADGTLERVYPPRSDGTPPRASYIWRVEA